MKKESQIFSRNVRSKNMFLFLLLLFSFMVNVSAQIDEFETYIQNKVETWHIPGLSTVIVNQNGICWEGYFGMANFEEERAVDTSTTFMLASISKTITATAVLKLHEEGYFELDDDINDFLPDSFSVHIPAHPDDPITFRQLLNHKSSIRDNWSILPYYQGDSPIPLGPFLYNCLDTNGMDYDPNLNFFGYTPGTYLSYCNIGITLLGYLVEVIAETPFNEYCNQNLFDEMDMYNSHWFLAETDTTKLAMPYAYISGTGDYITYGHYGYSIYPAGQLRSTARDLGNFLITYINGGKFNEGMTTILDSATVQLLTPFDFSEGLTWKKTNELNGYWVWYHGGGGQGVRTAMGFNPQDSIGVIILTNGDTQYFLPNISPTFWNFAREHCIIDPTISTEEIQNNTKVKIFPNPSYGWLQVSWEGDPWESLQLFHSDGRLIKSWNPVNKNTIKLQGIAPGLYCLQFRNNRQILTKKIVVIE